MGVVEHDVGDLGRPEPRQPDRAELDRAREPGSCWRTAAIRRCAAGMLSSQGSAAIIPRSIKRSPNAARSQRRRARPRTVDVISIAWPFALDGTRTGETDRSCSAELASAIVRHIVAGQHHRLIDHRNSRANLPFCPRAILPERSAQFATYRLRHGMTAAVSERCNGMRHLAL